MLIIVVKMCHREKWSNCHLAQVNCCWFKLVTYQEKGKRDTVTFVLYNSLKRVLDDIICIIARCRFQLFPSSNDKHSKYDENTKESPSHTGHTGYKWKKNGVIKNLTNQIEINFVKHTLCVSSINTCAAFPRFLCRS